MEEGGREGGRDVPAVNMATLGWKWISATRGMSYPRLNSSCRKKGGREGGKEGEVVSIGSSACVTIVLSSPSLPPSLPPSVLTSRMEWHASASFLPCTVIRNKSPLCFCVQKYVGEVSSGGREGGREGKEGKEGREGGTFLPCTVIRNKSTLCLLRVEMRRRGLARKRERGREGGRMVYRKSSTRAWSAREVGQSGKSREGRKGGRVGEGHLSDVSNTHGLLDGGHDVAGVRGAHGLAGDGVFAADGDLGREGRREGGREGGEEEGVEKEVRLV